MQPQEARLKLPLNNKKRIARTTIFIACEGCREHSFLSCIKELFKEELDKKLVTLEIDSKRNKFGGDPKVTINRALKKCEEYEKVIALIDEDKELTDKETIEDLCKAWCVNKPKKAVCLQELKNLNKKSKNPIIVLSQPLSIESVVIKTLGKKMPKLNTNLSNKSKVDNLKGYLEEIFGFKDDANKEKQYYINHLKKDDLLRRVSSIPTLKELFNILKIL